MSSKNGSSLFVYSGFLSRIAESRSDSSPEITVPCGSLMYGIRIQNLSIASRNRHYSYLFLNCAYIISYILVYLERTQKNSKEKNDPSVGTDNIRRRERKTRRGRPSKTDTKQTRLVCEVVVVVVPLWVHFIGCRESSVFS